MTIDGDSFAIATAGLSLMPISASHGQAAARLPMHHRDPFDRMLIAQAQLESCSIVSRDASFAEYSVALIAAQRCAVSRRATAASGEGLGVGRR